MHTDTHPTSIKTAWQALQHFQKHNPPSQSRQKIAREHPRTLSLDVIQADFSRHPYDDVLFDLLCQLADAAKIETAIQSLFAGEPLNRSENRPALHTALRNPIDPRDSDLCRRFKQQIAVENLRLSQFVKNSSHQSFHDVVVIGIGGSFAGPCLAVEALTEFRISNQRFHFLTTVDDQLFNDIFQQISPDHTLFIVSSKSFSTLETLTNFRLCLDRLQQLNQKPIHTLLEQQFIAITARPELARSHGFTDERIFHLWDSIGGRFSVWSAIGLPIRLLIGNKNFDDFLAGAALVDHHVQTAPLTHHLPARMALLSIWYHSIVGCTHEAIIPYPHRLRKLIPYLQQLVMESNGKSVTQLGDALPYGSSPVIFGEEGNIGQHAYHQLLHQGQHVIPIDFFILAPKAISIGSLVQYASCRGQADALFYGKTSEKSFQNVNGNKPNTIFTLDALTPRSLGMILALYEHKTFIQATILGLNPFDQWGVELGKELANRYLTSNLA